MSSIKYTYPPLEGSEAKCCIGNCNINLYWGLRCIQCINPACDKLMDKWNANHCGSPCNGNCSKLRGMSHVCVDCGETNPEKISHGVSGIQCNDCYFESSQNRKSKGRLA